MIQSLLHLTALSPCVLNRLVFDVFGAGRIGTSNS
jgi:hypothetical protein